MSAHRSPKTHRDLPDRSPRLVDDVYYVEPEPVDARRQLMLECSACGAPVPAGGWFQHAAEAHPDEPPVIPKPVDQRGCSVLPFVGLALVAWWLL